MTSDKTKNLIDYIIKNTNLKQADIAKKLKVSRAQVSKWKAGDHISYDREKQLLKLAGLFETVCVRWAMFARTEENAQAWYNYFFEIIDDMEMEWGDLQRGFFHDIPDFYVGDVITELCDLGAKIEQQAPITIWIDEDEYEMTPLASALYSILETWGQIRVWIENAFELDYVDNEVEYELSELITDLEWLSFDLALGDVERSLLTAIGINQAKLDAKLKKSRSEINAHVHNICKIRTERGLPITDDYFQLLYLPPIDLAESTWSQPPCYDDFVNENTIQRYLPYGQQLIFSQLRCNAIEIGCLNKKLDEIISMLSKGGDAPRNEGEELDERP